MDRDTKRMKLVGTEAAIDQLEAGLLERPDTMNRFMTRPEEAPRAMLQWILSDDDLSMFATCAIIYAVGRLGLLTLKRRARL